MFPLKKNLQEGWMRFKISSDSKPSLQFFVLSDTSLKGYLDDAVDMSDVPPVTDINLDRVVKFTQLGSTDFELEVQGSNPHSHHVFLCSDAKTADGWSSLIKELIPNVQ